MSKELKLKPILVEKRNQIIVGLAQSGFSQYDIADVFGVSRPTVQQIINSHRGLQVEILVSYKS